MLFLASRQNLDWRWIGLKKDEFRLPRRLQHVTAKIFYLCPTYIDYLALYPEGPKHEFANLNKKYFTKERWDQFVGLLEEAVRWNTKLNLVIETIEEKSEKGTPHRHHYVIEATGV